MCGLLYKILMFKYLNKGCSLLYLNYNYERYSICKKDRSKAF